MGVPLGPLENLQLAVEPLDVCSGAVGDPLGPWENLQLAVESLDVCS